MCFENTNKSHVSKIVFIYFLYFIFALLQPDNYVKNKVFSIVTRLTFIKNKDNNIFTFLLLNCELILWSQNLHVDLMTFKSKCI